MAWPSLLHFIVILAAAAAAAFSVSVAAGYNRPKARETLFVPVADDAFGTTPQQVHIAMSGAAKMRVMWITKDDSPAIVEYGTEDENYIMSNIGTTSSYSYTLLYHSGKLHEVVIGPLVPDTVYYYRCGGNTARKFSFKTPPDELPIKFAVAGDLDQTGWTNSTLAHLSGYPHDILLAGDLSYADFYQPRWDSFGRLVEPLASCRPWMVTQGNHDIESIPFLEPEPFRPYNARWHMPFDESASASNLFYSFDAAGGSVHVIMLGSYADFGPRSDQFRWLRADLCSLDRVRTPWLIVVIHAPWYNSNEAHQGEGEAMRRAVEEVLYDARVDMVFAGHVHAYKRFMELSNQSEQAALIAFTSFESVTQACAQMNGYSLDDKKLLVFMHKNTTEALEQEMKERGQAVCFREAEVSKREAEAEKIVDKLEPFVKDVKVVMKHDNERVKHRASES